MPARVSGLLQEALQSAPTPVPTRAGWEQYARTCQERLSQLAKIPWVDLSQCQRVEYVRAGQLERAGGRVKTGWKWDRDADELVWLNGFAVEYGERRVATTLVRTNRLAEELPRGLAITSNGFRTWSSALVPAGYSPTNTFSAQLEAIDRWLSWWNSEGEKKFWDQHPEVRPAFDEGWGQEVDPGRDVPPGLVSVAGPDPAFSVRYRIVHDDLRRLLLEKAVVARRAHGRWHFRFANDQAAREWFLSTRAMERTAAGITNTALERIVATNAGLILAEDRRGSLWFHQVDADVDRLVREGSDGRAATLTLGRMISNLAEAHDDRTMAKLSAQPARCGERALPGGSWRAFTSSALVPTSP